MPTDRRPEARTEDPMAAILAGIDEGSSLIIFPEGNRNDTAAPLLRLAPGRSVPGVEGFNARIRSWLTMALLLGVALLRGRAGVVAGFADAAFRPPRDLAT